MRQQLRHHDDAAPTPPLSELPIMWFVECDLNVVTTMMLAAGRFAMGAGGTGASQKRNNKCRLVVVSALGRLHTVVRGKTHRPSELRRHSMGGEEHKLCWLDCDPG